MPMLVAGVGNIFQRDDGFGVEVARRLLQEKLPGWVRVMDFGIRGVHLAYELADGEYETTVLVDAAPRGGPPGTVYLIEPDVKVMAAGAHPDAHSMTPETVFATLHALGGKPRNVFIVGCEPADTEEGMGLTEPVARAVDEAVRLVIELIERKGAGG